MTIGQVCTIGLTHSLGGSMGKAHTHGPWKVIDQPKIEGLDLRGLKAIAHVSDSAAGSITTTIAEIISEEDAERIVLCCNHRDFLVSANADAAKENIKLRAINADLLAALEVAYEHINGGPGIKTGSAFIVMWEQTRNAIAKARGQA